MGWICRWVAQRRFLWWRIFSIPFFWGGVSRMWPRSRAWLRKLPKGELLEQCLDACRAFGRRPGFIVRAIGISMLVNIAGVLQLWAVARGLDLNISPLILFLIVPM